MHGALHYRETEALVHALRQLFANPTLTMFPGDVPAFDVPDRARRIASFRMGAQTKFEKAGQRAIAGFGDEDNERQRSWSIARKDGSEFARVFFGGGLRPERLAQTGKRGLVRGLREPHMKIDQHSGRVHFAAPGTKMDLGSIMWTPLLPSTSSVIWRSAATLESM